MFLVVGLFWFFRFKLAFIIHLLDRKKDLVNRVELYEEHLGLSTLFCLHTGTTLSSWQVPLSGAPLKTQPVPGGGGGASL